MNVQRIACRLIDFPEAIGEPVNLSTELTRRLTTSIAVEGMFNAIVVRPDFSHPGRYIGVQGRRRLYAVGQLLKREFIDCNVLADMDDDAAEMARISENLWRAPRKRGHYRESSRAWWDHWRRLDKKASSGVAGGKASETSRPRAQATGGAVDSGGPVGGEDTATGVGKSKVGTGFSPSTLAATGKSKVVAPSQSKIARPLDANQLEAFRPITTNQLVMVAIVTVNDEASYTGRVGPSEMRSSL